METLHGPAAAAATGLQFPAGLHQAGGRGRLARRIPAGRGGRCRNLCARNSAGDRRGPYRCSRRDPVHRPGTSGAGRPAAQQFRQADDGEIHCFGRCVRNTRPAARLRNRHARSRRNRGAAADRAVQARSRLLRAPAARRGGRQSLQGGFPAGGHGSAAAEERQSVFRASSDGADFPGDPAPDWCRRDPPHARLAVHSGKGRQIPLLRPRHPLCAGRDGSDEQRESRPRASQIPQAGRAVRGPRGGE